MKERRKMVFSDSDREAVSLALDEFNSHPDEISSVLEHYLSNVADSGQTTFAWSRIKPVLLYKLDLVTKDFHEKQPMISSLARPNLENTTFEDLHQRLMDMLQQFNGAPFTIQRLCELVTNPRKHYQKTEKFMRGVEKTLAVVTTVDPFGVRVVHETKNTSSLVNGMDGCGSTDASAAAAAASSGDIGSSSSLLDDHSISSPYVPPAPRNSPATAAAATAAGTTATTWFTSLSSVVDSPSSYPSSSTYPGWVRSKDRDRGDSLDNDHSADDRPHDDEDPECTPPPRKQAKLESQDSIDHSDWATTTAPTSTGYAPLDHPAGNSVRGRDEAVVGGSSGGGSIFSPILGQLLGGKDVESPARAVASVEEGVEDMEQDGVPGAQQDGATGAQDVPVAQQDGPGAQQDGAIDAPVAHDGVLGAQAGVLSVVTGNHSDSVSPSTDTDEGSTAAVENSSEESTVPSLETNDTVEQEMNVVIPLHYDDHPNTVPVGEVKLDDDIGMATEKKECEYVTPAEEIDSSRQSNTRMEMDVDTDGSKTNEKRGSSDSATVESKLNDGGGSSVSAVFTACQPDKTCNVPSSTSSSSESNQPATSQYHTGTESDEQPSEDLNREDVHPATPPPPQPMEGTECSVTVSDQTGSSVVECGTDNPAVISSDGSALCISSEVSASSAATGCKQNSGAASEDSSTDCAVPTCSSHDAQSVTALTSSDEPVSLHVADSQASSDDAVTSVSSDAAAVQSSFVDHCGLTVASDEVSLAASVDAASGISKCTHVEPTSLLTEGSEAVRSDALANAVCSEKGVSLVSAVLSLSTSNVACADDVTILSGTESCLSEGDRANVAGDETHNAAQSVCCKGDAQASDSTEDTTLTAGEQSDASSSSSVVSLNAD